MDSEKSRNDFFFRICLPLDFSFIYIAFCNNVHRCHTVVYFKFFIQAYSYILDIKLPDIAKHFSHKEFKGQHFFCVNKHE